MPPSAVERHVDRAVRHDEDGGEAAGEVPATAAYPRSCSCRDAHPDAKLRTTMIPPLLTSLILKLGPTAASKAYEWAQGSEATKLVSRLKRKYPTAPKLLLQPDALGLLWEYSLTGRFPRQELLKAVGAVEPDLAAATALVDAIKVEQIAVKTGDERIRFGLLKLRWELRQDVDETSAALADRLEQVIASAAAPARPAPRCLPRARPVFTNRVIERAQVVDHLRRPIDASSGSAVVITLVGSSGIGKSTLAVRAAHDVADDYDDGQLYADLRAADGTEIHPGDVAAELLRQLGVEPIPDEPRARATALRSAMVDKRLLVLLDNATDHALLPDLIPASGSCGVLLTSHRPIPAIDPDLQLQVLALAEHDAIALMDEVVGGGRVRRDEDAARAVARACLCVPALLRAVADWLTRAPEASLAEIHDRIETGELDERARNTFLLPYELLSEPASALFRALGAVRANGVAVDVAAALVGMDHESSLTALDEISQAGLVDITDHGVELHELMHRFAAHELRLRPEERDAVEQRLTQHLLERAETASGHLQGERASDA
jgi:hypothetical protein